MKNLFLLFSLFFLIGCTTSNDDDIADSYFTDMIFNIEYLNRDGKDLLDPLDGTWETKQIRIFYLNEEGYPITLANEESNHIIHKIKGSEKRYYIRFVYTHFITSGPNSTSLVYIFLPNGDIDKIEVQAKGEMYKAMKEKMFYNDELVWDRTHKDDTVTIIK
ncbi:MULTISPECIES: hypothetical protein [unclassified Myroides]|uniref:hypothetical protein n=1 Tax=unclassified Myroides TaxID=2642485 RepID=UPI003D2F7619